MPNSSDISAAFFIVALNFSKPCVATTFEFLPIRSAAPAKLPVKPASWLTPKPALSAMPWYVPLKPTPTLDRSFKDSPAPNID